MKTVPPLRDLVTGKYQVAGIRSASVEDLLRRDTVDIDTNAIASSINGASVVVTGGGGFICCELVRQILTLGPRARPWWTTTNGRCGRWSGTSRPTAGAATGPRSWPAWPTSGRLRQLNAVLRRARPDVVFHAAALKHVPYVENFPAQGVPTTSSGPATFFASASSWASSGSC